MSGPTVINLSAALFHEPSVMLQNAYDAQLNFYVLTGLSSITISDEIWNMFDIVGELPLDPAENSLGVRGISNNDIDLLALHITEVIRPTTNPDRQIKERKPVDFNILCQGN